MQRNKPNMEAYFFFLLIFSLLHHRSYQLQITFNQRINMIETKLDKEIEKLSDKLQAIETKSDEFRDRLTKFMNENFENFNKKTSEDSAALQTQVNALNVEVKNYENRFNNLQAQLIADVEKKENSHIKELNGKIEEISAANENNLNILRQQINEQQMVSEAMNASIEALNEEFKINRFVLRDEFNESLQRQLSEMREMSDGLSDLKKVVTEHEHEEFSRFNETSGELRNLTKNIEANERLQNEREREFNGNLTAFDQRFGNILADFKNELIGDRLMKDNETEIRIESGLMRLRDELIGSFKAEMYESIEVLQEEIGQSINASIDSFDYIIRNSFFEMRNELNESENLRNDEINEVNKSLSFIRDDFRDLQTKLSDLNGTFLQMSSLNENELRNLSRLIENISTENENNSSATKQELLSEFSAKLNEIKSKFESPESANYLLDKRLASFDQNFTDFKKDFQTFRQSHFNEVVAFNDSLSGFSQILNDRNEDLKQINETLQNQMKNFSEAISNDLKTIEKDAKQSINASIDSFDYIIRNSFFEMRKELNESENLRNDEINEVKKSLSFIKDDFRDLQTKLSDLNGTFLEISSLNENELRNLSQKINDNENSSSVIKKETLSEFSAKLNEIKTKFDEKFESQESANHLLDKKLSGFSQILNESEKNLREELKEINEKLQSHMRNFSEAISNDFKAKIGNNTKSIEFLKLLFNESMANTDGNLRDLMNEFFKDQRKQNSEIKETFAVLESEVKQSLQNLTSKINSSFQLGKSQSSSDNLTDLKRNLSDEYQPNEGPVSTWRILFASDDDQNDKNSNKTLTKKRLTLKSNRKPVYCLTLLQNALLAAGGEANAIKIWNTTNGSLKSTLKGHTAPVRALATLKNGNLVSGSEDTTIKIWSSGGKLLSSVKRHTDTVQALAVFGSGNFASGSWDKRIKIWTENGTLVRTLVSERNDIVCSMAVLPDDDLASGFADGSIEIWGSNGVLKRVILAHAKWVWALALGQNGDLVSGSKDRSVKIWNFEGQMKKSLAVNDTMVFSLAVLPNGDIASGGGDGKIKIFSENGLLKKTLVDANVRVDHLSVLPGGELASACSDGTVKIWTF